MPNAHPRLRPVETIFVQDRARGRVLMLRDSEGLAPVIGRFDGRHTTAQIAADATRATGQAISVALVEQLAAELDAAVMLDTPRFRARRREIVRDFAEAKVRPASHAGGAYHADPG